MAMGRPPHEPTDENRLMVYKMALAALTQEQMARVLQVSVETLIKYYSDEVERGGFVADAEVAHSLYENATIEKIPACQMFWMKTRRRWRETGESEGDESKKVHRTARKVIPKSKDIGDITPKVDE